MEDLFDKYSLNARVRPGLLMLLPTILSVAASVPGLFSWAEGLVGLAIACGATLACAHFARHQGRRAQERLLRRWGVFPTTAWLRHLDSNLDSQTKQRYHSFLEDRVPDWSSPTIAEERVDPSEADQRYSSAIKWLLEQTRDTRQFPLIFKENVSYGFRRNSLGLKPYSVCVLVIVFAWYSFEIIGSGWNFETISATEAGVIAFSAIMLLWWIAVVRPSWVKDGADAYATALLAACDRINPTTSQNP